MLPGPGSAPFGRCAAAMITPFGRDGALDPEGARRLATHLVDRAGCDALVVNGTTGESPTTSDAEKSEMVRTVAGAVGRRATVVAGVGSSDTRHTVALAREAEAAGADGLLVVTPAYSRPPQESVVHHLLTVADSTELPVMLYDIPERTGTELSLSSLQRLAEHPRIVAVKDCAGDLLKTGTVLATTSLACYAGSDEMILPLRAMGASGVVSTLAQVAGPQVRAVLDTFDAGGHEEAARLHRALLPLAALIAAEVPGTVAVKALFRAAGLPGGAPRPPLQEADAQLTGRLVDALKSAVG